MSTENKTPQIEVITREMNLELSKEGIRNALLATAFKEFDEKLMRQAVMEGMMRGFTFTNFLQKDIYAIKYGGGYSLITSIDYARKVGMRSGVIGTSKPEYEYTPEGKIDSCTITVKRRIGEDIGEFTATVFFNEFTTGKQQWASKPKVMIAKVAEMHALRKACPEQLSQAYDEAEMIKEVSSTTVSVNIDLSSYEEKLNAVQDLDELKKVWSSMPQTAKNELEGLKEELKAKFETPKNENTQVQ